MFEPYSAGFIALHRRAGLPALLLPGIQAALTVWREAADGRGGPSGPRLARSMIEAALTACETLPVAEARGLVALLSRFEAEAARDEARLFAQEQIEAHARDEAARLLAAPEALPATDTWPETMADVWDLAGGSTLPEVIELPAPAFVPAPEGPIPSSPWEMSEPEPSVSEPALPDAGAAWPLAPRPEERLGAPVVVQAPSRTTAEVPSTLTAEATETLLAGLSEALMASVLSVRSRPRRTRGGPRGSARAEAGGAPPRDRARRRGRDDPAGSRAQLPRRPPPRASGGLTAQEGARARSCTRRRSATKAR